MNFSNFRRHMSAIVAAGFLAGSVVFGAGQAQAMVYSWNITNLEFVDEDEIDPTVRGTINGTFQFDTAGGGAFSVVNLNLVGATTGNILDSVIVNFSSAVSSALQDFTSTVTVDETIYVLNLFNDSGSFGSVFNPVTDTVFATLTRSCILGPTICMGGALDYVGAEPDLGSNYSSELAQASTVPVPAALPLFGTGLAIMGFLGWRRKSKAAA